MFWSHLVGDHGDVAEGSRAADEEPAEVPGEQWLLSLEVRWTRAFQYHEGGSGSGPSLLRPEPPFQTLDMT